MTALFPTRVSATAAAIVVVALGAAGFLPLFGGPGYEHAVASGVVLPSAVAIATALEVARVRGPSLARLAPSAALGRGVHHGIVFALLALATAFAHVLRVGACDLVGGTIHFVLTAGIGAVLAGLWGALAGELARSFTRPRLAAVLFALAGPLGGIGVSVARFYGSPMIFAFDPFFGYFSGTLYDTVIDAGAALLTYRAGSLLTVAGVLLVASALGRAAGRMTLRLPVDGGRGARLVTGIVALAASAVITAKGPELGHWQTSQTIARELGGELRGPRCTVIFPSAQRPDEAALLLANCEQELASVERVLGARGPEHVTAFFFRDSAEKRRLMGAADTLIAKPWRAEVYVQLAAYPHPVLGHELAHVVAGAFGRGPFRISAGRGLASLLPNPGLIEGVAVAASPDDDELTDAQWARAMRDVGILPPLAQVFSLQFLGAHASKSYTVAGAFVAFVLEKHGAAAVRAWYGGASLEEATGKSLAAQEADFHAYLDALPFPEQARTYARAKFERKGVFARLCPHVVDALRREADGCRDARQTSRAVALYDRVLSRDGTDYAALWGRALTLARATGDDASRGRAELDGLVTTESVPETWRDRSEETLADLAVIDAADATSDGGDGDGANATVTSAAHYLAIAARSTDEDAARTLEVKAAAVASPEGRAVLRALLLGTKERPADIAVAFLRLERWREHTGSPLADYLLGKNFAGRGAYDDARAHLTFALDAYPHPALTPRIAREIIRQRAIVACILGERHVLVELAARLTASDGPFAGSAGGRREAVASLLRRCMETPIPTVDRR